jgi:hypothetical protein
MSNYKVTLANEVAKIISKRKDKVTNKELRLLMLQKHGVKLSSMNMQEIIAIIRKESIIKNLCADWEGYWIEQDKEKTMKYIKAYEARAKSIMKIVKKMKQAIYEG